MCDFKEKFDSNCEILNWIMDEYKLSFGGSHNYIKYNYHIINFSIILLGGLLTAVATTNDKVLSVLIYSFVLPVSFCILGLFYCYNAYAISRSDLFDLTLEKRINTYLEKIYQTGEDIWFGRRHFVLKDKRKGFIIPYGTMLMFYILLPIASIIYSFMQFSDKALSITNFMWFLPAIIYIIYIILMVILIRNNYQILNDVKKLKTQKTGVTITIEAVKGGAVTGTSIYEQGETVNLKATPSSGYRFAGWYDKETGTKLSADANYSFTASENMTLYVQWEKVAQNSTETGSNDQSSDDNTPATGDTDNQLLWIVLFAAAIAVYLLYRRKSRD